MYGYNSVGEFLVQNNYDPKAAYNMNDIFYIYSLLTGKSDIDFVFSKIHNKGYKEKGNLYTFTMLRNHEVTCSTCKSINTINVLEMLDNKIKHGTWCRNCAEIRKRQEKKELDKDLEGLNETGYRTNTEAQKIYKLVPVVDRYGRPTNDVRMVKRSNEEIANYDINKATGGALSRGDYEDIDENNTYTDEDIARSNMYIDRDSIRHS